MSWFLLRSLFNEEELSAGSELKFLVISSEIPSLSSTLLRVFCPSYSLASSKGVYSLIKVRI
jgi:hypothetical protein